LQSRVVAPFAARGIDVSAAAGLGVEHSAP
jgi:hypothetical protein